LVLAIEAPKDQPHLAESVLLKVIGGRDSRSAPPH
jgi:hypothetical protein